MKASEIFQSKQIELGSYDEFLFKLKNFNNFIVEILNFWAMHTQDFCYVCNEEGYLEFVNSSILEFLKVRKEDCLGKPVFFDIYFNLFKWIELREHLEQNKFIGYETKIFCSAQEFVEAYVKVLLVESENLKYIVFIAQKKSDALSLKGSFPTEITQTILDSILDLIVITDVSGNILDVRGGLKIPFDKKNIIGMNVQELKIPKKIIRSLFKNMEACAHQREASFVASFQLPDKSQYFFYIKTFYYSNQQFIHLVHDITESKLAELEKEKLYIETQQLNEELIANQEELRQLLDQTIHVKNILEKREAYYKTLIASLPDFIFELDLNYIIEFAHIPSQKTNDLVGSSILDWLPMENRKILKRKFDYVIYTGETNSFEFIHKDDSSVARTYLAYIAPVKDNRGKIKGLFTVLKDITEMKMKESKLQELSRQLNSIIEYGIQNTVLLDVEGRIIFADTRTKERIAQQVGKEPQAGDLFKDFLTGELAETFEEYFRLAVQGQVVRQELQAAKDIWLDVSFSPVFDEKKKKVTGVVVAELNITARKIAEAKLIQTNEQLVKHNTQLNHYSYVVSHNLRAPVATLLGLIKIFEMQGNQMDDLLFNYFKDTTLFLDNTVSELNQMLASTSNFDKFKKVVELQPLMNAILASQTIAIDKSKAKISCQYEVESIKTVKTIFQSILENLISNSVKYRKPDVPLEICIKFHKKNKAICVDVTDNGLGIDMNKNGKDLFRIYKRFHPHIPGEGIGLYLVKTQVEMLGGTIHVDSKLDEGTTFRLIFQEPEYL
ncbi:MAG: PAS domain-containing protein [Cytophagales bacterium]|nr:PAS domain-containing protein [Cytophagales bacterium]MDW8383514.1 PAS domain-containing protein [Flammeovirgaceae bacterium]